MYQLGSVPDVVSVKIKYTGVGVPGFAVVTKEHVKTAADASAAAETGDGATEQMFTWTCCICGKDAVRECV